LAACRVVFREIVRVDKCEQRKGGENYDQYPDKFPLHGLPDRTGQFTSECGYRPKGFFWRVWKPRVRMDGIENQEAVEAAISKAIT